jgi:hypothetical protein
MFNSYKKVGQKDRCAVVRIIEPLTKVVDGKVIVLNDKEKKTGSYPVKIYHLN